MDLLLKKKVLAKIKEIYPNISNDDLILVYGSRSNGLFEQNSDVDVMIFTNNYLYFKKTTYKKKLRRLGEDVGFSVQLDNGITLETKIYKLSVPKFNVLLYHDILNSLPLSSKSKVLKFKSKIKKEFLKNYDSLLFNSYVHLFNEFKNIEGLSKKKGELYKINLSIKKAIVVQALLRLILVMDKKPFVFDKYLSHEVYQTKYWKKVKTLIKQINNIVNFDDYIKVKVKLKKFIESNIESKPYVGKWWRYLSDFKKPC